MRVKKTLKNSIYSFSSYVLLLALGLISRKLFLDAFHLEFAGYDALFSNIFSILTLAEMGVGFIINYSIYRELANGNKDEIAKLVMIYKYMYRIIGTAVTIIGFIIFFFLEYLITDNTASWSYIRIIYLLQLSTIVCTYFLSYRRILYISDQKEYVVIKVDTVANIILRIVRIAIIVFLHNYIIYLIAAILSNVIANIIIAHKCNRDYPYARKASINKEDFQKRNFFSDIKNFLVHKVADIVYFGVDNIIISILLGINSVGLFGNYHYLTVQVSALIKRITNPLQASIGNLVYSDTSDERGSEIFYAFELMGFFIASFVAISYLVLFQPFIARIWLKDETYLLPYIFVVFTAINGYIKWNQQIVFYFRCSFGKYDKDKWYMMASAIVNLGISVALARSMGLPGIMLGTVIGHLFIWFGRVKVVFSLFLKTSRKKYFFTQIIRFGILAVEALIAVYITGFIGNTFMGFILKALICLIVPNLINVLIFCRTKEFSMIKMYSGQVMGSIKGFITAKKSR